MALAPCEKQEIVLSIEIRGKPQGKPYTHV